MTNAEKYKEVFGVDVESSACPTSDCNKCPCLRKDQEGNIFCKSGSTYEWWNQEYKGGAE